MAQDDLVDDLLLVGRVARAHGNRGQVIVNLETDFPEDRFKVGQTLFVGGREAPTPRQITEVRFHQGRPIVALDGIATMNEAEDLAGAELWIRASTLAPLPEGTYYRHDLVGCEVTEVSAGPIGRVTSVDGPLERSLLVVAGRRGEILIPLTADICIRIDPSARVIVVRAPEGLLEANE
jgi:16S rRNA processing protein RimM